MSTTCSESGSSNDAARDVSAAGSHDYRKQQLDSLEFSQIESRHATIENALANTCRWLLETKEYVDWINDEKLPEHHGFLWIRGKPGTGKSTITKFTLAETNKATARNIKNESTTAAFFFNARGEELERSTVGMYRSLLLQIFRKVPDLQALLNSDNLLVHGQHSGEWHVSALKNLFRRVIEGLGRYAVVCFVDALDECEQDDVRDMVEFFEELGEYAVTLNVSFRTFFSSRHYPHITIEDSISLILEDQVGHSQDIEKYVNNKLRNGKTKLATQIKQEILTRASGIFLWVVLVIRILRKDVDSGRIDKAQSRLRDIPDDLEDLFNDILRRDGQPGSELVLCLQWVLFARRPLRPEELYFAISAGIDLDNGWPDPCNREEITEEVLTRFILNASKGLVEETKVKSKTVQFIHETVREFFVNGKGLGNQCFGDPQTFLGRSHDILKQCCQTYFEKIDVVTHLGIKELLPKAKTSKAVELRRKATDRFPFLDYAVQNVLYHSDRAQELDHRQKGFVESFPLTQWVVINNLLQIHEVRRYTRDVSLLYILAESDLPNLISIMLDQGYVDLDNRERYGSALSAALAADSRMASQILFSSRISAVHSKSQDRDCAPSIDEIREAAELLSGFEPGEFKKRLKSSDTQRSLFGYAVKKGSSAIVRCLLWTGAVNVNAADIFDDFALIEDGSHPGHERVIKTLLQAGANINASSKEYGRALTAASISGNAKTVSAMISAGAQVNAEHDSVYGTALIAASCQGHVEVVSTLLRAGTDVNTKVDTGLYGTALIAASYGGFVLMVGVIQVVEVVSMLLKEGADANMKVDTGKYGTALIAASCRGHVEVVSILLHAGADVNMKVDTGKYSTALIVASRESHVEVVSMLLKEGADVNMKVDTGEYGTALIAASCRGHVEVVSMLLKEGADVNMKVDTGRYGTALIAASYGDYIGVDEAIIVVLILLHAGADVNIKADTGLYGTALIAASRWGHVEVVSMLLKEGADVNMKVDTGKYYTALIPASRGSDWRPHGPHDFGTFLIQNGADLNAYGTAYRSAYHAAASRGRRNRGVMQTLLQAGANKDVE